MLHKARLTLKRFGIAGTLILAMMQPVFSQVVSPEHLEIEISKSGVTLDADQSGLTAIQRAAIQQYFERKVQNTSFVNYGGRFHLNLAGEWLRSLQTELARIDPANTEELDQAMNLTLRRYADIPWSDDFDNARVIIGQAIQESEPESGKLLIVVGSTGDFIGSAENAIIVGSHINFVGNGHVERSLLTIGSEVQGTSFIQPGTQRLDVIFPYDSQAWFKSFPGWGRQSFPEATSLTAWPGYFYGSLVSLIMAFAFGALYISLAPQLNHQSSSWLLSRKGAALGLGILGYVSSLILLSLLVISIIGILLIPSVLLLIVVLSAMGYFTVASTIGNMVLQRQHLHDVWKFSLGLILLQILGLVPWLGWLMIQLTIAAGFGALLHTIFVRFQGRRKTPPRPTEPWHRPAFRSKRWKMPVSAR